MIDTVAKRFSLLQLGRPWVLILPPPDGLLTAQDRRLLARFYAGELESGGALPRCMGVLRVINDYTGTLRP